jgi:hypothetical protein
MTKDQPMRVAVPKRPLTNYPVRIVQDDWQVAAPKIVKYVTIGASIIVAGFAAFAINQSYNYHMKVEQIGLVSKLAYKGNIWKSWEVEIAKKETSYDGKENYTFYDHFSLDRQRMNGEDIGLLVNKLEDARTNHIPIKIESLFTIQPLPWRGDEHHYVQKVEPVQLTKKD